MHECQQDERIRSLTTKVDKMEVTMENTVDFQRKIIWGLISTLMAIAGVTITILLKMKGVG